MTESMELTYAIWGVAALVAAVAAALLARGVRADQRERARAVRLQETGRHIPPTLHPVIDTQACISSAACVAACPEGDVLGLVAGSGRLIHGAACVGHGRCAAECPVDAIRLVFGTAERGVDIPHVTPSFESSRAGIYIAGELGGMGLIRNALRQGMGAARHALSQLKGGGGGVDVLIVGAGPAGLAAALTCVEAGASYALIDQDKLGGTPANYPRHKLVMTEPVKVPLFGTIHRYEMTKEELMATWQQVVEETRLEVRAGVKLTGITGSDGAFTARTTGGDIHARKVVLAIGRRGSPRKLGVPGEDGSHVTYGLLEPHQYQGAAVMVVGGGDSGLEAAQQLEEAGAAVTLVHRGASFTGKPQNISKVDALAAAKRIQVRLNAATLRLDQGRAEVETPAGREWVPAQYVLVLIGGELPAKLLKDLDIRIERWSGAVPEGAPDIERVGHASADRRTEWWAGTLLLLAGLAGISWLAAYGGEYYALDAAEREFHEEHKLLRSSGPVGHGIGVVATLVMLTNFFYVARKRLPAFRRWGTMRAWLTVHAMVGLLAPAFIAFHAAFTSNNFIATVTTYAMAAVVVTGVVGRSIYGRMHAAAGGATGVGWAKRLMRSWRVLHVVLAVVMVLTIAVHLVVSILFGYRWVFS